MTIEDLCSDEIECIVHKSGYGKKYYEYKKEIDRLNQYIDIDGDCEDNEVYHSEWDELLVKILKENGFEEIAKEYEKAQEYFWYA